MSASLLRGGQTSASSSMAASEAADLASGGGGDGPLSVSPTSANVAAALNVSPLNLFVKAKKKINEIYKDVGEYVNESQRFLHSAAADKDVADAEIFRDRVDDYDRKVRAIHEVLVRDHMKVVFFGRTSNGKSTAINALLGDKILPMGIGHTTSCFMQIEGGHDADDAYLMTEDSQERKSVASIGQLGNALSKQQLGASSKVRIVWPKEKCKMLGQEVVMIDSPGIDVETDLDEWIDKFCLDSDVFVLVANAESTLMLTEKRFFHKVSERLSNPNIFIVHNRSDAFAGEDMQHEVREQHQQRALKFLTAELKVCTRQEAEDRIFFISAKEALQARMQEARNLPPQISTENFFPRYLEFQAFEKKFGACLSSSAVRTKFAAHTQRGRGVITDLAAIMAAVNASACAAQRQQTNARKELFDRCDFTEKQLELMTLEMKEKIESMTEDVEYKVGRAMNEEIKRLSVLVDEFDDPFHPDPLVLNVYRSNLNHYVESGVGSNLKGRLSADLQLNMESHQSVMIERLTSLLPAARQQVSRNILPHREAFEVLYHLHCDSLCQDFREDIRFRFSLGLGALVRRFSGGANGMWKQQRYAETIPRGIPISPEQHGGQANDFFIPPDDWSIISKVAIASLSSQGTMAGMLVGGLLFKTVGWRIIILSGAVYGAVYAYERLTWTNTAKCREFKRQYVEHAARKLRLIVDMTSANCSHQVQQELSSTFARLCHLVDETTAEMKEDIKASDKSVKDLDEVATRSKVLRNQANFIANKLELFEQSYLRDSD